MPRDFDSIMCECGHVYGRHPWYDNPIGRGRCLDCRCRLRRDAEVQAEARRRASIAADPAHVHVSTHTVYGCPGFIASQECDECGATVS